jgi:hypothetical protein
MLFFDTPPLGTVPAEGFAAMNNGRHTFVFRNPTGTKSVIYIHITKARARIRQAQFDLIATAWAFRRPETSVGHGAILPIKVAADGFGSAMRDVARKIEEPGFLLSLDPKL